MFLKSVNDIKKFFKKSEYVKDFYSSRDNKLLVNLCLLAGIIAFSMSAMNIYHKSYHMFLFTFIPGLLSLSFIFLNSTLNKECREKNNSWLRLYFNLVCLILNFTYILVGGNDGFTILWIIPISYILVMLVDFRLGLYQSILSLIFLLLCFIGPLKFMLMYNYTPNFKLRFIALYSCSVSYSIYGAYKYQLNQYQLLLQQKELEKVGFIDFSTNLLNRNSYNKFIDDYNSDVDSKLACIYIDINGLHAVNNSKGHSAGDELINFVANTLKETFPSVNIYRIGGDEFVLFLKNTDSKKINKLQMIADQKIKSQNYSVSWGIAIREGTFNILELIEEADAKMLAQKSNNKRVL